MHGATMNFNTGTVTSALASGNSVVLGGVDLWRLSQTNQSAYVGHHKQFYMW